MQYLITFCSRLEAASDVISGKFAGLTVPYKSAKFRSSCLKCSREIPSEAIGGDIFEHFRYNFRSAVDNNVISGVAADNVGMDVPVQFGDSRSNGLRYSRSRFRVKRTSMTKPIHFIVRNALEVFRLKNIDPTSIERYCSGYC